MSVGAWLKRTFRPHSRFSPSVGIQRIPSALIRAYTRVDVDACRSLYSLNEPGRFPLGYLDLFTESLESPLYSFLVVESAGQVVAVGGICRAPDVRSGCWLVFGMVHPDRHREGFGTAMLLARLAALPRPTDRWWAFLSSAGGSSTFYERFGFQYCGRTPIRSAAIALDCYRCYLEEAEWATCGRILEGRNVHFDRDGIVVPVGPR
jgi:GNAT superfamily N-acetyltransferase